MKREVEFLDFPPLTVYLSHWFPFFGQGFYCGVAFVKYVKYSNFDGIYWQGTNEVIRHEYGHYVSRLCRGFWNFWLNILWDYSRVWIKHDKKPMEIEARKYADAL